MFGGPPVGAILRIVFCAVYILYVRIELSAIRALFMPWAEL